MCLEQHISPCLTSPPTFVLLVETKSRLTPEAPQRLGKAVSLPTFACVWWVSYRHSQHTTMVVRTRRQGLLELHVPQLFQRRRGPTSSKNSQESLVLFHGNSEFQARLTVSTLESWFSIIRGRPERVRMSTTDHRQASGLQTKETSQKVAISEENHPQVPSNGTRGATIIGAQQFRLIV